MHDISDSNSQCFKKEERVQSRASMTSCALQIIVMCQLHLSVIACKLRLIVQPYQGAFETADSVWLFGVVTSSRLPPAWLESDGARGRPGGNSDRLGPHRRNTREQSLGSLNAQRLWKSRPQPEDSHSKTSMLSERLLKCFPQSQSHTSVIDNITQ